MKNENYKDFCKKIYNSTFNYACQDFCQRHKSQAKGESRRDIEIAAQKEAIKQSVIQGLEHFPQVNAADIWRAIYEIHVHHKSGIGSSEIISKVISADQSWKKSSGHAFEEMVKQLASMALEDSEIEIILQRDLNTLIKADEIDNEPRDISWLKEQIAGDVFDLYAIVTKSDKRYCFGCLQCKTIIRDRVTRDRGPSLRAM